MESRNTEEYGLNLGEGTRGACLVPAPDDKVCLGADIVGGGPLGPQESLGEPLPHPGQGPGDISSLETVRRRKPWGLALAREVRNVTHPLQAETLGGTLWFCSTLLLQPRFLATGTTGAADLAQGPRIKTRQTAADS